MGDDQVHIRLSEEQALVLFEWLSVHDEHDTFPVRHPAEEIVFWLIHGQLETALRAQFASNYLELVQLARERVVTN